MNEQSDPCEFDRVIERVGTGAYKWDGLERVFGSTDLLPMWVADMDFPAPPAVIDALRERTEHGIFGYTLLSDTYKQAIQDWQLTRHEWAIEDRWIVQAPGVVPSLSLAVQALTEPGDKVILQSPVYPPFYDVIRRNGRELVNNRLREADGCYEIDFDHLEQQMKAGASMLLLCHPHNPVGRAWTRSELEQLAEMADRHGVLVVSDEIHCDWTYEPRRHVPFQSVSDGAKSSSIVCMAPSKTFNLAGLHTSYMIIPDPQIRMKVKDVMSRLALNSHNVLSLIAAEAAYRHGAEWLDNLKTYVRDNMEMVAALMQRDGRIQVSIPEATYLMWLDLRQLGMDVNQLRTWMVETLRIGMNEGRTFGEGGERFLRLNAATPRVNVQIALERWERALAEL